MDVVHLGTVRPKAHGPSAPKAPRTKKRAAPVARCFVCHKSVDEALLEEHVQGCLANTVGPADKSADVEAGNPVVDPETKFIPTTTITSAADCTPCSAEPPRRLSPTPPSKTTMTFFDTFKFARPRPSNGVPAIDPPTGDVSAADTAENPETSDSFAPPRCSAAGPDLVEHWLADLGLAGMFSEFASKGYDTLKVCAALDDSDLDALGVSLPGVRKKLKLAAGQLLKDQKRQWPPSTVFPSGKIRGQSGRALLVTPAGAGDSNARAAGKRPLTPPKRTPGREKQRRQEGPVRRALLDPRNESDIARLAQTTLRQKLAPLEGPEPPAPPHPVLQSADLLRARVLESLTPAQPASQTINPHTLGAVSSQVFSFFRKSEVGAKYQRTGEAAAAGTFSSSLWAAAAMAPSPNRIRPVSQSHANPEAAAAEAGAAGVEEAEAEVVLPGQTTPRRLTPSPLPSPQRNEATRAEATAMYIDVDEDAEPDAIPAPSVSEPSDQASNIDAATHDRTNTLGREVTVPPVQRPSDANGVTHIAKSGDEEHSQSSVQAISVSLIRADNVGDASDVATPTFLTVTAATGRDTPSAAKRLEFSPDLGIPRDPVTVAALSTGPNLTAPQPANPFALCPWWGSLLGVREDCWRLYIAKKEEMVHTIQAALHELEVAREELVSIQDQRLESLSSDHGVDLTDLRRVYTSELPSVALTLEERLPANEPLSPAHLERLLNPEQPVASQDARRHEDVPDRPHPSRDPTGSKVVEDPRSQCSVDSEADSEPLFPHDAAEELGDNDGPDRLDAVAPMSPSASCAEDFYDCRNDPVPLNMLPEYALMGPLATPKGSDAHQVGFGQDRAGSESVPAPEAGDPRPRSAVPSGPMPDYSALPLPELKRLVSAYGIKPKSREFMVAKLQQIWTGLRKAPDVPASLAPLSRMQAAAPEAPPAHESLQPPVATQCPEPTQGEGKRADLHRRLIDAIKHTPAAAVAPPPTRRETGAVSYTTLRAEHFDQRSLYERVLLGETIDRDEVAEALVAHGIKCPKVRLDEFLTEQGISWKRGWKSAKGA